jgi:predicted GIY-YIG superfamily endonuclease
MGEVVGTVYLLHFERPYQGRMQHYLGWTVDLERRVQSHREGTSGSVTTTRAFEQGIGFEVVRTWPGGMDLERLLKARGVQNACPICEPAKRAERRRRRKETP